MRPTQLLPRLLTAATIVAGALSLGALAAPSSVAGAAATQAVYDSTTPGLVSAPQSWGFQSRFLHELGNEITLSTGSSRVLDNVHIELDSWACQKGGWNNADCVTTPGATYTLPVTVNLYAVGANDFSGSPTPGALLSSVTQTVTLPYRPSADTTGHCTGGQWFDGTNCHSDLVDPATIALGGITVPDTFIYGVTYNTSDWGPAPLGDTTACALDTVTGCAYDNTNIALTTDGAGTTVGTNTQSTSFFFNAGSPVAGSTVGWLYCDGGTGGPGSWDSGIFRFDSGCDSSSAGRVTKAAPAVQFNSLVSNTATITSAASTTAVAGKGLTFKLATNAGGGAPATITSVGVPAGYKLIPGSGPTAGTAKLVGWGNVDAGDYTFAIHATNGGGADTVQTFTLHVLAITSVAHAAFTVGTAGSFTVVGAGGHGAQTLVVSHWPPKLAGLSLHDNGNGTATISGTPAAFDGSSSVTVVFTSGGKHTTQKLAITIAK